MGEVSSSYLYWLKSNPTSKYTVLRIIFPEIIQARLKAINSVSLDNHNLLHRARSRIKVMDPKIMRILEVTSHQRIPPESPT